MASNADHGQRSAHRWRVVGWGGAVALLLLPVLAMQFTRELDWTLGDFIVFGVMIATVGGGFELAVRASGDWAYRGGAAMALAGTFLVVWANLAVGIVGNEHNPANQLVFFALLAGLAAAAVARFRPRGVALAMLLTGSGLMLAFAIAMIYRPQEPGVHPAVELAGTSVFALIFVGSATLFRRAARADVGAVRGA